MSDPMSGSSHGVGAPDRAVLFDPVRVAAVRRVLAAADEPASLDRLTRLAAQLLGTAYSQVSLLTAEQVIASIAGRQLEPEQRVGPASESLCTVTLEAGAVLAIEDAPCDGRVCGLPPVRSGLVGSYLGAPLVDAHGHRLGALCVYDGGPRTWTPDQQDLLADLAACVVAELELRAVSAEQSQSSVQLDLALSAAEIGSYAYDVRTQGLEWDDRLLSLFGYSREEFSGDWDSFSGRVHPDDLPHVQEAMARAIEAVGDFSAEYRILVPGVGQRWVQARGRAVPDLLGRPAQLLGAAFDVTELRTTRDALARVLETMSDAFFSLDRQWRFSYVNGEAERVLLRRREDLLGRNIWEEFPEAGGSTFQQRYDEAVATGQMASFEEYFPLLDTWFEVRAWPTPDGLSVYFHDINERRQAEAEREAAVVERERAYAAAGEANARLRLLADASTLLSQSLEPRAVLQTLADLLVPRFGDYVVVALLAETAAPLLGTEEVGDPDRVHVVHLQHAYPEQESVLADLMSAARHTVDDATGLGAVVRTGVTEWQPIATAPAPLQALSGGSTLTLPLASRGRRLGALTVAGARGSELDRALLDDLAGRAGVALDNALLFGAERRTGLTLQRSLLPRELPELPGLTLAPRYLPGATGAFVGGDWYQGVPYGDGIVLAMGDVMGHGMRSAARMGQLRAIVATLALEGHRPGELLRRLAASTPVLLDLELATLLVCHYSLVDRTLTVASAGHPPPLLAPRGGVPAYLDVVPGPPIGAAVSDYDETVVAVPPGATVVLYTDGLIENREESLTEGLARLERAVTGMDLAPEPACDRILAELGRTAGGADDIALLVLAHA